MTAPPNVLPFPGTETCAACVAARERATETVRRIFRETARTGTLTLSVAEQRGVADAVMVGVGDE